MTTQSQKEQTPNKSVDLLQIFISLWQRRKLIAIVVGVTTIVSVIVSFLLPETYISTAVLLPDTDKSKLGNLGGLSDIASMVGVGAGGEVSLIKLYPTIIKSEAVLDTVLFAKYQTKTFRDSVNLIQFWEISARTTGLEYEKGMKSLREGLQVSQDQKTGVVTISIETREPKLSADIVNNVCISLDRFIRVKRTSNASEQRKWIEGRLREVKSDLEKSENALKDFREKNRIVSNSPQLLLTQERYLREVQMNSTIYAELKKQYELAKIEEIKNIPIVNVMDRGKPSATKASPRRRIIVLSAFLFAFVSSAGYTLLRHKYTESIMTFVHKFNKISKTEGQGG